MPQCWNGLPLSQPVAVCPTAYPPPSCCSGSCDICSETLRVPRETRLPSSYLMQMLRSPGLEQACGARQARLKCDETEWSEPLGGLGSWLRCVRVEGVC